MRLILRAFMWSVLAFALVSVAVVLIYRFVPPPGTPLMVLRKFDERYSGKVRNRWVPLHRISRNVLRAVIASEDARFCRHNGFDLDAIETALKERRGGRTRGASTITQQTAKNLFLWPNRDFVRKGLEAWFAILLEVLWSKDRILEIYLNVAEWGDGVYGIESAARRYYRRPARSLTRHQSAYLAAVLPNARIFSPVSPSQITRTRAESVLRRMDRVALGRRQVCP
ncbi:MAG: monofunctional biosynthetic peptidoglycan transglycosylase [Alphaproteobacteria bacterium]|nr:monofunctional biosynthetic peptidoglycan transglycosylase [Alphaproteobacteria bacterium]